MRVPPAGPPGGSEGQALLLGASRKPPAPKPLDFLVIILLPWLIFSLIICLFSIAYQDFAPLVWALVAASGLLGLLFVAMGCASGRGAQLALGCLIATSVAAAAPVGLFLQSGYMAEYWRVDSGAEYWRVSPLAPGASYADASVMEFEAGSAVDTQHSLGYMRLGEVSCIAPILGPKANSSGANGAPQYFAAGKNCCGQRGGFNCGDTGNPAAHSGVTLDDSNGGYATAVRMAASAYQLPPAAGNPVFVRWTTDANDYKESLWNSAATLVVAASAVHLVGSGGASLLLSRGTLR